MEPLERALLHLTLDRANQKNVDTYSFGVRVEPDGRSLFARGADV
jgi:hypothetical protein